ncbi:scaffoldin [Piromyces finnis]|uniref:Scaffoldin n=1 Tax=Piromyces finnis TaxID=1754191 RepID=A0A1Y1UW73_9FUNG|nr:scaffoldin [Piromyces finnis]|eukprot:ORX42351.1 scaffoldin [Piromyces finnis]
MLISKRIKWLSLQYLVLLSLSKNVLGQDGGGANNAVLTACGEGVPGSCTGLTSSGYCLEESNIYKLKAATTVADADGSCNPITGAALKQFKADGSSEVTISNNSLGVLYKCVAGTTNTDDPSTSSSTPKKGYYLSSTTTDTKNKLYSYVGDSPFLKALTTANDGYYLSGEDFENSRYNNLIKCTSESCIKLEDAELKSGYYLCGEDFKSNTYNNLIYCDSNKKCSKLEGPSKSSYYVSREDFDTTEVDEPKKGYYLRGELTSSDDKPISLFECKDKSCTVQKPTGEGHYLDASGIDAGGKYSKLILCKHDASKKCESAAVAAESMPYDVGNYYFLDRKDTSKVIKCTYSDDGNKCEEVDGEKKAGYGYIDFGAKGNVIACTEGTCKSLEKVNAQAEDEENNILAQNTGFLDTSEGCTSIPIDGVQGHAFLDGTSYYSNSKIFKNVIKCMESGGCTPLESVPSYSTAEVYIDAEISGTTTFSVVEDNDTNTMYAYIDASDKKKIITCDATEKCKSDENGASFAEKVKAFYINGLIPTEIIACEKEDSEYKRIAGSEEKGQTKYYADIKTKTNIIKCDWPKDGASPNTINCVSEAHASNSSEEKYYYIDGYEDKNILACDKSNGCISSESLATTSQPSYYVDANESTSKSIITCTTTKCTSEEGETTEGTTYKDSLMIKKDGSCIYFKTKPSFYNSEYYARLSNGVTAIIECDYDTTSAKKSICKLDTTTAFKTNSVYRNALFNKENGDSTNPLIICDSSSKCTPSKAKITGKSKSYYINSDVKSVEKTLNSDNQLIICKTDEGCTEQKASSNANNFHYYVNAGNQFDSSHTIQCYESNGCKSIPNHAIDKKNEIFLNSSLNINADPTNVDKLNGDLIKCKNDGSKITCEVTYGNDGDIFLNANYENDAAKKPLIICTTENECATNASKAESNSIPAYYVNAVQNIFYDNSGENDETNPLIKCNANGCKVSISSATEKSKEYYINAGDADEKPLANDIIECTSKENVIQCEVLEKAGEGVYVKSNYSENGDAKQLIQCRKDTGCAGIKTSPSNSEYFVNAEATDLNNAIIFCANKKCEKQTPTGVPTYYVGSNGDSQEDQVNGLIECTESEPADDDTSPRRKRATEKKCKLKPAFTSNGYYLNSGYNKAVNQTILCDSSEGCATEKVILGYYVNAGDATKPVIKCEKEGTECVEEESKECPSSFDIIPGNYCYSEGSLKFYPSSNSTAISASKSDDIYTFATIPANGFPGIKSETGALFKISRYYINRFCQSGVVMIDKNGKLVDNLSAADQSDISVYDCNDSTKMCTERSGCTSNTYMFDSENKKAVFCNNNKLEYAEFTGYVVDGNRAVGTNHPYIIHCENNGSKCESIKPKVSSYYENNGYDSSANGLIECSGNNCITVGATVGYYVGHEGKGIIQCTSSTSCVYADSKSKVKYVNAGSNKSSNAIISCTKDSCVSTKANTGYYLTYTSTLLIQCTNPSNCVEFTPSVNYYDNADSSESSNTIINCVQNSQVITCSTEATNSGFYISSTPNVLIRCKSGNKCKTVTVKNGIFRGAIKSNTSGSKRSDDEKESQVESSIESQIESEVEVEEKCSALSPSEVSAIPICEFNNNKCYITNEYAMTKSATTSISAGSICTNNDRSVFYFATDTVVVKPNVISGSTTTYIYTTTNSNCLEVNDSYSDMYFTVGSNIYLLDQGSVLQFYEQGYYFINTAKNAIVGGSDIDNYNDKNVKLYRCNGSSCSILDKPDSLTFYADVNKRILRYNVNSGSYSFAYEKDIICIFANNKCTPNADLKNQEFCITYKGELALAEADIKNRETGECYKASSLSSTIYGYSQSLYSMNLYSAEMIDETGYYIVSLSTNTNVVSKNYKTKNNKLVIYGCQLSSCKEIEPEEYAYYYDSRAKTILRYKDGAWKTPETSGYAYISIDPVNTYIYRFTKINDEVKINGIANYGYYYTVDGEMYNCNQDEGGACTPVNNTGYYFTNAGEVYYCVHDSENLEPTECTKQACISGQYYYIDEAYYRCESSSSLVPVMSRYCSYNENVIINFPLALTEEYPDKIKQAVEGIEKNNNSTAIIRRSGKNYLESVSGIFTNCTYNVEETKSTFDLVCVNNFVKVDEETDDVKICSIEKLSYVECTEEEENPEKCNVSFGISRASLSIPSLVISTLLVVIINESLLNLQFSIILNSSHNELKYILIGLII